MVEEDQIKKSITSTINLDINIDEVLNDMRSRFAPPSNLGVVRRSWIKEALDKFVDMGLGLRRDNHNSQYEIHFRKPRGIVVGMPHSTN
jgi:hypothetical protein